MRVAGCGAWVAGIRVINRHNSYHVNKRLAKKIISEILKFCRKPETIEIEVIFLDDKSIKVLNKKYKGKNRPTDVLAFNIDRRDFGKKAVLGEAFISIDRAAENARIFGTRFEEELALYIIHAILHIFGYDDESAAGRRRMFKKQTEILEYLWKRENLSQVLTLR